MAEQKSNPIIIDGTDMVVGRVASYAAKKLLNGEEVTIINAEKMVIAGKPENTFQKYAERRERGRPQKGPFFPRRPDMLVRRAVRGMLPIKKAKGREAFRRLKVFMGNPGNLSPTAEKPGKLESELRTRYVRVMDLSKKLGWKE